MPADLQSCRQTAADQPQCPARALSGNTLGTTGPIGACTAPVLGARRRRHLRAFVLAEPRPLALLRVHALARGRT